MPFRQAANGRIARHLANRVDVDGQHQRIYSHSCRSQCRLNAGVSATDNDNPKGTRINKHNRQELNEFDIGGKTACLILIEEIHSAD